MEKKITIIGAGLSGILLTIHLLKEASTEDELHITLIDGKPGSHLGAAYSTIESCLLLNVPACRMGALAGDPAHFLKWVLAKGFHTGEWDFLPRKLYREYVLDVLQDELNQNKHILLKRIVGEATDLMVTGNSATVTVNDQQVLSDKVVLAFGNFPPRDLCSSQVLPGQSARYIKDPWNDGAFSSINSDETIFLIGTGQTTTDVLMRLHARGHNGKIQAISRHGYLPLAHTAFAPYPSFRDEIIECKSILEVLRTIRKHFMKAEKIGMDKNAVIDSIRPFTQQLWLNLPLQEKETFLRHLFRYFEIIRSRIPAQSMAVIEALKSTGQFTILKGRIQNMSFEGKQAVIQYLPKGAQHAKEVKAEWIINCTGPELDYNQIDHPLIVSLMRNGWMKPHASGLGIDAYPDGSVIGKYGLAKNMLYTLGSTMRGVLWEVIAVTEIREQAGQLARLLLSKKE